MIWKFETLSFQDTNVTLVNSPFVVLALYVILERFCTTIRLVCKEQELKQSETKSSPLNQNGKELILQIVKIHEEHMVNRVSSSFPKTGFIRACNQFYPYNKIIF